MTPVRTSGLPLSGIHSADLGIARGQMLAALLRADTAVAGDVADHVLERGYLRRELFDDVMAPALREVGEQWSDGEVSVIQEHLATRAATAVIQRLAPTYVRRRASWLVATLEGEEHLIGALMTACTLAELGMTVDLCRDIEPEDVAALAVNRAGVCLACTGAWSARMTREAAHLIAEAGHPVLVGGAGVASWSHHPNIEAIASMEHLAVRVETGRPSPPSSR